MRKIFVNFWLKAENFQNCYVCTKCTFSGFILAENIFQLPAKLSLVLMFLLYISLCLHIFNLCLIYFACRNDHEIKITPGFSYNQLQLQQATTSKPKKALPYTTGETWPNCVLLEKLREVRVILLFL